MCVGIGDGVEVGVKVGSGVGVGAAVWLGVPTIYIVAGIAAWAVVSVHLSFTALIHELCELHFTIVKYESDRKLAQQLS